MLWSEQPISYLVSGNRSFPLETLFDFVLSAAGFDILFTAQLSYFVVVHKGNQSAGKLFQCKKSGFRSQLGKVERSKIENNIVHFLLWIPIPCPCSILNSSEMSCENIRSREVRYVSKGWRWMTTWCCSFFCYSIIKGIRSREKLHRNDGTERHYCLTFAPFLSIKWKPWKHYFHKNGA